MTQMVADLGNGLINKPKSVDGTEGWLCRKLPYKPTGKVSPLRQISAQQVHLGPDQTVMAESMSTQHLWIVQSGLLRFQRYSMDGRRQILSLALPGDVIGLDMHTREGLSIETATESTLCKLERRVFDRILEQEPGLRKAVYTQHLDQLERLRWLTWSIGALRPDERLCGFLALATRFMTYDHLPDGTGVLSLSLSRLDIADLLGTTVETISRITHRLADDGILEIRKPEHLRIIDLDKLTQLGKIDGVFDKLPFDDRSGEGAPGGRPCKAQDNLQGSGPTLTPVNESVCSAVPYYSCSMRQT